MVYLFHVVISGCVCGGIAMMDQLYHTLTHTKLDGLFTSVSAFNHFG